MFRTLFGNAFRSTTRRRTTRSKFGLDTIESLETRLVLFAASGNAWPTSQLITISFEPDGTNLGGVNSDLFKEFNGNSNLAGRWQSEILRAAQTWSEATNINFVVVADNGAASGSGKNQQGDTGFGDIRIGGYDFQNTSLARAYMPPTANNFSVGGDIAFNTGIAYGVGQGYDLYSVALHELGHALGLDHTSASSSAAMWSSYNGIKTKLSADDIAGIRSIYSGNDVRDVDSYEGKSGNNSFATATDISSEPTKAAASAVIDGLDITTATDTDYYKFTAPKWTDDTVVVSMQATGLSMLAPKLTVYAADQKTVIGTATGTSSGTVKVTLTGVDSGEVFYVKAEAASPSSFSVGNYAITLDLGAKTAPTAASPKTTMANGKTPTSKGGVAEGGGEFDDILSPVPVIQTISPDTGASSTDLTTSSSHIVLSGVAPLLSTVTIFQNGQSIGSFLSLLGAWSYSVPGTLADGNYTFVAQGHGLLGLGLLSGGYSDPVTVTIDTTAPAAPSLNLTTGDQATSMSGTSDPSALITIYDNGQVYATTTADGHGNWSLNTPGATADGSHHFTATAKDQAGNESVASGSQSVAIDTTIADPSITGINSDTGVSSQDSITQTRNLIVYGLAEAGSTVTLFCNGVKIGTTAADSNGKWAFDNTGLTLNDGLYVFTAQAKDAAGNVSNLSGSTPVIVDSTLATPSISYVNKTSTLLLLNTVTVQGVADANSSVKVFLNGSLLATITADSNGNWTYQYNPLLLGNGTYRFSASASDVAGNQTGLSSTFNLVIGSSAPTVSNLTLTSNGTTPTVSGTGTKGATISIFDGNKLLGTTVVSTLGKWTFTTPSLKKGSHTLVAVATDATGNSAAPSAALTITL